MSRSWAASMQVAVLATLGRPEWWAMALAGFLIRGGFLVVLLPVVALPSAAAAATSLAPIVESLVIGGQSVAGVVIGMLVVVVVLAGLAVAGLAGAWLDLALVREAAEDEDVELGWAPVRTSPRQALAIRLAAHLPTILALGYAFVRLVTVTYDELLAPGDAATPVAGRVLARVPDAILVVVIAWLVGETVGTLAARRAARGMPLLSALGASVRQLASRRGLATLGLTSIVLVGLAIPFLVAVGRAWEHLRAYLLGGVGAVALGAALVLLVATWILGLAVLGAGLAWRASAWTVEVPPA